MTAVEAAAGLVAARRKYTAAVDAADRAARAVLACRPGADARELAAGNYRAAAARADAARRELDAANAARESAR